MSFRTALGDFELDSFKTQKVSVLLYFSWIMFVIAVFVSLLVFLNFIIAVISESYEKVMTKQVARAFKEKVSMINERESQFTEKELQNPIFFPRYLVLRTSASSDGESEEWQGFIKDIKKEIASVSCLLKQEYSYVIKKITSLSAQQAEMKD